MDNSIVFHHRGFRVSVCVLILGLLFARGSEAQTFGIEGAKSTPETSVKGGAQSRPIDERFLPPRLRERQQPKERRERLHNREKPEDAVRHRNVGFYPRGVQDAHKAGIPYGARLDSRNLRGIMPPQSAVRTGAQMSQPTSDSVAMAWCRQYASGLSPSDDHVTAIAADRHGNIYAVGYSSATFTGYDYFTVKYDGAGVQQWVARYDGPGNSDDLAYAVALDASENVYVTGSSIGLGTSSDFATIKYNSAGIQQWVARYDGPASSADGAVSIGVDTSGNVYVVGVSYGPGTPGDYVTIKYNAAGLQEWIARYDGPGSESDQPTSSFVDACGNVYVTGSSYAPGTGRDYATIKYSSTGVQQWVARYDGDAKSDDCPYALAVDRVGNVYVTGTSMGLGTYYDYATVKYSPTGIQQWAARYSGPGENSDGGTSIGLDTSGNVYVTGWSWSSDSTSECATIKYDSSGTQQWVARYSGAGYSSASSLAVDSHGNVYVAGGTGVLDYCSYVTDTTITIEYSPSGTELWVGRYFKEQSDEGPAGLVIDTADNFFVGVSLYDASTYSDLTMIKYKDHGQEQWVESYNGPGCSQDQARAIAVDGSGNVYVTGSSYAPGTRSDYATVKYDGTGLQEWIATYNGPVNDYDAPSALAVDVFGNVYVTGRSANADTSIGYATIKYSPTGVQQWIARYNGVANGYNSPSALAVDSAGNVYVTGTSEGYGTNYDYVTVKYSPTGVQQWIASYNGDANGYDIPSALAVDGAGNVYVTGSSEGVGTYSDYVTIRYDSAGNQKWVARFKGSGNSYDKAICLALDREGNVYVSGVSESPGTSSDFVTVKYDATGGQQWVARYNDISNGYDSPSALAIDPAGNVYVTGASQGLGTDYDFATVKYNAAGMQRWVARYEGFQGSYDDPCSIAIDTAGNVYVAGVSYGSTTNFDYATLAYDTSGNNLWAARYVGSGNSSDYPSGLALDRSGNVYVTGSSSTSTWSVYTTIKYRQALSASSIIVLSPNGGETWSQGTSREIKWSKKGLVDSVRLEYSTDNGVTWTLIKDGVPAVQRVYLWNVPNTQATQVRVRITWLGGLSVCDVSDSPFSITGFSSGPWLQYGQDMGPIWALAMNPREPQTMYAGSNTSGVWKTTNGGHMWEQTNKGLINLTVQALGISKSNPEILYCGTSARGPYNGVYKSTDAGLTWIRCDSGITETSISIQAIAIDPTNPDVAFVASFDQSTDAVEGIFKTTNGGTTWIPSNKGVGKIRNFLSFAIDPFSPNVVYAGSSFMVARTDTLPARIYKSIDGGATWADASVGLPNTGGTTFHDPIRAMSIDAEEPNRILAGVFFNDANGGAYLSTNGGTSWTKVNNGLPNSIGMLPRSVLIKPGSTTEFFIGFGRSDETGGGVYRTTDGGMHWAEFNVGAMASTTTVRALCFRPSGGQTLFAGGANPSNATGQGVFVYQFTPTTSVHTVEVTPTKFALEQNYPNPFNPTTTIQFSLPRTNRVTLAIYDLLGREVVVLVNEEKQAGTYKTSWNATGYSSGVYFYRLQAGNFVETKKLVLLR